MTRYEYVPCAESDIPAGVRFTVPRHLQGQTVERAYGHTGREDGGPGDPWMRFTDETRRVQYFVRRDYACATGVVL